MMANAVVVVKGEDLTCPQYITTGTALKWYMITVTTPKSHLRSRRSRHVPIIIRSNTNFWHGLQLSAPSEIKTQTECDLLPQRCIFLKKKKIHDWHRSLRIVPYRAIIYASFSKRAPMTVTWSHKQVNNTLIVSRRAYTYTLIYIGDQGIVHKIGPRNRHWGAFANKCINNRTIRHDAMHLWGSTSHAVYSIPLCFYLGWSAYLETMSNIRFWPYYNGYMTGGGGFLGWTWEWFQRSYIIVTSCLWYNSLIVLLFVIRRPYATPVTVHPPVCAKKKYNRRDYSKYIIIVLMAQMSDSAEL